MPYRFELESECRVFLIVYEGEVRGWDISQASQAIAPHFDELKLSGVIADLTAVTNFDVAAEVVRLQSKAAGRLLDYNARSKDVRFSW